ncbi:hypothetical protein TorRG33x02_086180 [Trema orientale]|uniref:Uncharacterized protein n=1 Tax=Trema orientale TaxID=63057 RepID=A0A2P5FCG8_TREOI|nr:hypothetical protein TorRG33x02_086180 [Trema orientale]
MALLCQHNHANDALVSITKDPSKGMRESLGVRVSAQSKPSMTSLSIIKAQDPIIKGTIDFLDFVEMESFKSKLGVVDDFVNEGKINVITKVEVEYDIDTSKTLSQFFKKNLALYLNQVLTG